MFIFYRVDPDTNKWMVGYFSHPGEFCLTRECGSFDEAAAWTSYLNGGVKPET